MWMTRARSVLSVAALAAAALFGAAGPAQGALYAGSWDPLYGAKFPGLGWSASAVFDVPAACLALGSGNHISVMGGSCGSFSVVSARVGLYDASEPGPIRYFDLDPHVNVTGINLAGGQLTGVDTGFFAAFVPQLSFAGDGRYSFSLLLYGGTNAQLIYATPVGTSPGCVTFPVEGALCGASANAAHGVFAPIGPVPEPETYALLIAGLGAIGFVARRRRT